MRNKAQPIPGFQPVGWAVRFQPEINRLAGLCELMLLRGLLNLGQGKNREEEQ
jgi:hypothetical protein